MSEISVEITVFEGNALVGVGSLTDDCIHDVEVSPNYRRRGIGTKIVKALQGIGGKWLWVDTREPGTVLFYEKCGFRLCNLDGETFERMIIPTKEETQ